MFRSLGEALQQWNENRCLDIRHTAIERAAFPKPSRCYARDLDSNPPVYLIARHVLAGRFTSIRIEIHTENTLGAEARSSDGENAGATARVQDDLALTECLIQ